MKLLPEEPTQEMLIAGWDHYFKYSHNAALGLYKAMYAAAPEVKDEPVGWCKDGAIEEGRAKKQSIVVWTDKYSDTPVELFLHPSPRIAELELEVVRLKTNILAMEEQLTK